MKNLIDTSPTILSHAITGIEVQPDFAGSVEPISIVPDTPIVSSGAQFSLNLTLSTPPATSSTVGVYIQPVVAASSPPAHPIHREEVPVHFNLNVDIHGPEQGAPATAVSMQLVLQLLPNQAQQPIHLLAPTVTTPSRYVVSVLGHDDNNHPTAGVSTTITVHP